MFKKLKKNRERLRPIVETIIFLGRQNMAFRGHRGDGRICAHTSLEAECNVAHNKENFRDLLKFRVSAGDHKLEEHLK